jgi:4-hydroxy-tetrahydrodipicolinate reductase
MSLKLALIGYGKMGKMLVSLAAERDCQVVSIIDPKEQDCFTEINEQSMAEADVCIDFSHPASVVRNMHKVIALKKHLVVGTTGWFVQLPQIEALVAEAGTGLLYGANFSIGMNIFSRIVADAVKYLDCFAAYDVYGSEAHHNQKADSPSGTAIELSKIILANSSRKSKVLFDAANRRIEPSELHFTSLRAGNIPGTHTVGFDSEADTIELTHRVRSRSCFAYGALQAAQWINGRKGCFSINDMISGIIC